MDFVIFGSDFELFDQIRPIFDSFWTFRLNPDSFNQIRCDNVKSDNEFRSKTRVKSDTITKFFEIIVQVD